MFKASLARASLEEKAQAFQERQLKFRSFILENLQKLRRQHASYLEHKRRLVHYSLELKDLLINIEHYTAR
ncbi:unnamed protein product [Protopolystoma xenopodis]|uniref:Uncharacterized protein n=1 Tax=Protopolystoma xenopodis TaxID=117903 RepID=A0A3S5AGI2_9PLAT|nr:unnamed protein product [Protopolystoma xenopodis]